MRSLKNTGKTSNKIIIPIKVKPVYLPIFNNRDLIFGPFIYNDADDEFSCKLTDFLMLIKIEIIIIEVKWINLNM